MFELRLNMEKSTFSNSTFVRPATFYMSGFSDFRHGTYLYIFMCFVYVTTVFGNVALLLMILMYRVLHTPKYMIVFNLALTDLCGSTSLIPKLLDTLLFENRYISYELCLSYMFFVLFYSSLQSWTLATMAYDRFVAICFPLHYHRVITKFSVSWLLLCVWLLCLCIMGALVGLVDRLSFCQSVVVQSFFCDHESMYRIACNSASVNAQFVLFGGVVVIIIPLTVILCSYMSIAVVLKRASLADSFKALRTCSAHLLLVAIFFIPLIGARTTATLPNSNPNTRMINFMLTYTIPSLLNPFVYSLKTEEMLNLIKNMYGKCRINVVCV